MIPSSSYRCVYLALVIFYCLFGCTYPASWSSPSIASNAVSVVAGSWTSTTDVLIIGTQVPTATFSNVMRSSNGGSTWSEVQKLTSGNPQFYDISSRIIGSTTYSVVVAAGGTIYVSKNLFTSYSSGKLTGSSIQFYSVTIAPSGFAFAVGSASSRPAVYMSNSSTEFINWSPLSSSVFTASTKKLRGVATFDGQNILAVGTSLTVFQSANNGSTWSTVDLSSLCTTSSTDLYSVAYKNKNFAMIGGTNGCIVKYDKTSGSYAWNLVSSSYITSSSAFFYHSISIASNNIVFLIENVQGQILRSVDSGVTWYREQQSNNVKLYCVAAYDYNLALVGTDNTVNTAFVYLRAVDPSSQPTNQPSGQPSCRPTSQPSLQPVSRPSAIPSRQPSSQPSQQPIMYPSARPSLQPSSRPSGQPTAVPLLNPSAQPSGVPSRQPSVQPTAQPTQQPMMHPSAKPSCQPSGQPSRQPVGVPSSQPSLAPSAQPSSQPSRQPTTQPSGCPTTQPSSRPSHMPSAQPSAKPSRQPTSQPSGVPTAQPSGKPSRMPSSQPSASPTVQPTVQPSRLPTGQPSSHPTHQPTVQPSALPTHQPTSHPSMQPTGNPSTQPTNVPSSSRPTSQPTGYLLEGNWTSIAGIFDDSAYRFLDVRCSDTINCVMVGYYFDVVLDTNVGIIAHTAHGGVSKYVWSVVKRLPGYKVKAVTYYEPYSHWFALDHLGGVYGSTDSGETWISYWNFTLAEVNVTAAAVHNNLTSTVDVLNGIACNYGGGLYLTGPNIMWYGYIAGITGPDYSIDWKYTKDYKNINDVTETDTDVVAVAADEGKIGTCYYNRERGLECSLNNDFTTAPFYSVGATKNQLVGIATDGTVVKRDERNDWSRLPLNISEWTDSRDYGHNVVCLTNAVYYIADSGGRIYETKNGGTIWVNETLIAVSPLPLYSLYFWSTSVAIAGNGRGGTFIKRPKPSAAPTSHPSGMPTMQPSRQPICRPTGQPSRSPTSQPSSQPSRRPTTQPTRQPINRPTGQPSRRPTSQPSKSPTSQPSGVPSSQPQGRPSAQPSFQPSGLPTVQPTGRPSAQPSLVPSGQPSGVPSAQPSSQPSGMPSGQPSGFPTKQPTGVPSVQPTSRPSGQPSRVPTCQPSMRPSRQPSAQPSAQPIGRPSGQPSRQPTAQPSRQPSGQPSGQPSRVPTNQPSASPTRQPTGQPSRQPTRQPSGQPSRRPTSQPSRRPTNQPSASPTRQPTGQPSRQPSGKPSGQPTMQPSIQPTSIPSAQPSGWPSAQPTCMPSGQPSGQPTVEPTGQPSVQPTRLPSSQPSSQPSGIPSGQPSGFPSMQPTSRPSAQPSKVPTNQPTRQPSGQPTSQPSMQPLNRPTTQPSCQPSGIPSVQPSGQPSNDPSTQPSGQPTRQPSGRPTAQPSRRPTTQPSVSPSRQPTCQPTRQPVMRPSAQPTRVPTSQPSRNPTRQPTAQPSRQPTSQPTRNPTRQPTAQPSRQPFSRPTGQPSRQPSSQPSRQPTNRPTGQPSKNPSTQPSSQPSEQPSGIPTSQPSGHPSALPTCQPSSQPTGLPTGQPSGRPSGQPTVIPSGQPSVQPSCQPSSQPVGFPTMQPSVQPSGKPSMQPSGCPSMQPSSQPSAQPTLEPTSQPSCQPTFQPSSQPSRLPSVQPSGRPSSQPSAQPTMCPSGQPSNYPSALPTMQPTGIPSRQPVGMPSSQPTRQPSARPSRQPTRQPTGQPSRSPTMQPSRQPSRRPTSQPTRQPSRQPTGQPTRQPTSQPSASPTRQPTSQPSKSPTNQPTGQPSRSPSMQPSASPTSQPSRQPSKTPSTQPSASPTCQPSMQPTMQPTSRPSMQPSRQPTSQPTGQPSRLPTSQPSKQPYSRPTGQPSRVPTSQPSGQPSRIPTRQPTRVPTTQPTRQPVSRPTMQPTRQPWSRPTSQPSRHPTSQPSRQPSSRPSHQPTSRPTGLPSQQPASLPTLIPSAQPSMQPSGMPSGQPSHFPSAQPSQQPTDMPSGMPSAIPTRIPTGRPTAIPTQRPLCHPTSQPTKIPTRQPSRQPTRQPSSRPTRRPSGQPSRQPTNHPSHVPSAQPSSQPSAQPSDHPSAIPTGQPSKAPSVQPSSAPSVQPSGSPSTQPTKSPSSQPTSIPTTSFPTCQPSSQPSALPTTQPSVSPTKALLFAFSFNVTQAIQGSTEARYTRDKVNAVKAIVTTVTDIVPSTVYPDVRIIKVTDVLIGSRRLSGFEAEDSKDLLSGTKGILVVYGLTYIPTSKDKNDKMAEYQRTKLILTEAVQSGLFNSTLRENAILFNATSLFKANAVEEFFNVSSFIDSSFLHSPRPTSQPSSSPSQQPFSVPSSLPSSQPAGFPTSQPSVRPSTIPTSQPTFSLATKYTILLERLIEKYTLPQIYLKNVFYEGIARNDQVFDTCGMWTSFLDNNLEFSSLESSKLIKTVQLLQESQLDPSSMPQIKRCEVPRAATDIVNAVANRNLHPSEYPEKDVVSCDGDSWVVHTCGSTGSVALCVNCDDPCVDPYCAIPENISTINPYENANFSTGYITISPCVDENYDYSLCPVQDGLVRIFSVEMAPQSAGVLPVFFAYFTAGLILVFTAMYYERRVYSSSKKKVQDVRVFNTPSTRNVELDSLAEVYPSMKHSDSRGSGDFHGQNPSLEGPVHFKYVKTTMLTQLASIFRFTYFDPKINQSIIDDGPQEMAASNRQLREKLWLGVFPFHYFAMAYHSVLSGSRSLRIKYHILSVHRMILMVFFMSVFFNAQFVADDGTCNRQTSKSDCESFRTTFSTSVQTCLWKTGDFTVTSDTDSELFVPLCVWQDYQPTSDIYFRLVLVSLLIVAITRPIFHNKAIEQILFHNSKTIYFSNVLLSILQLGINRHRWLYMRAQFRALLRFCRKCIYRMYHCMDKKQAEVEMSPSEEVIVATSSRRNSGSSNRDASVRPETPVTPSAGRAAAAAPPPATPRLAVDHNTVSESVAIQISSDSSVLLNDFKQSLFSYRATFKSGDEQCHNFDLRWGIHPEDGTLFSLSGDKGCTHRLRQRLHGDHCDPEILLAEEMMTVQQEGNQVDQELVLWAANRQAYLDQKRKRKNTVVESFEDSIGKGLFLVFILDLIGRDTYIGMSFQRILYDTVFFQSQPQTTTLLTKAYLAGLLVIDALFVFYSVQYTRQKPFALQYVWFILAVLCLAIDAFVIEGLELLWCKVIVPFVINTEVLTAIQVLVGLINNYNGAELAPSSSTHQPPTVSRKSSSAAAAAATKEENEEKEGKEGEEEDKKDFPEGTPAIVVGQPATTDSPAKGTNGEESADSIDASVARPISAAAPAAPLVSASLTRGISTKQSRKRNRAASLSSSSAAITLSQFTVSRYFGVACAVTPKYKSFPHSTIIEAYRECMPPAHLAAMCHYSHEAVVEAARHVEVEDSTAYVLASWLYRSFRSSIRSSAYYFVLWTSAKVPTELQRMAVSCWTIFMVFVIYKLAKQVIHDVPTGLIAIFLIAAFIALIAAIMVDVMCPINFSALRSGVRVAQDWSANIFRPSEDKEVDPEANEGADDVFSSHSIRNEKELQAQHHEQVMEDTLNDVLGVGTMIGLPPLGGFSAKELQQIRQKPHKPEEYQLSESEYDSNDSDDDDDLSSHGNAQNELGDLNTDNRLLVLMASEREEAKMGESRGEVETSSSDEDDFDNDPEEGTAY